MNIEYMVNELVAPYVVLVAKDGSRFVPVEGKCKLSYNDTLYDLIAESDEATAVALVNSRSEVNTKAKETKALALAALSRVASLQAAK